jgi:hypothetical protein
MDAYRWIEYRKDGYILFCADSEYMDLCKRDKLFSCYLTAKVYSLIHTVRLVKRDKEEERKVHIDIYGNII